MGWELLIFLVFDIWLILKLVIAYYNHRRFSLILTILVMVIQGIYIMYV